MVNKKYKDRIFRLVFNDNGSLLKLSDAFPGGDGVRPCMELEAVMLNINLGHNLEIMERCRKLKDYACFVEHVRVGIGSGHTLEEAVREAVRRCIQDGILAEFLSEHKAEVLDMILYDYNEQEHIAMEREEAKEEGYREGRTEGIERGISQGLQDTLKDFLSSIGPLLVQLVEIIENEASPSTLRDWLRLSARVESIEEFTKLCTSTALRR